MFWLSPSSTDGPYSRVGWAFSDRRATWFVEASNERLVVAGWHVMMDEKKLRSDVTAYLVLDIRQLTAKVCFRNSQFGSP